MRSHWCPPPRTSRKKKPMRKALSGTKGRARCPRAGRDTLASGYNSRSGRNCAHSVRWASQNYLNFVQQGWAAAKERVSGKPLK
eukprot:5388135-Amphidinium_carterae.1